MRTGSSIRSRSRHGRWPWKSATQAALRTCRIALLVLAPALGIISCALSDAERARRNPELETSRPVTYVDAVVHAGATHYYFADADGTEIEVRESNDPQTPKIRDAELLLDPDPIEGPPGPNPDLIDRTVVLHFDDQRRVVGIDLVD